MNTEICATLLCAMAAIGSGASGGKGTTGVCITIARMDDMDDAEAARMGLQQQHVSSSVSFDDDSSSLFLGDELSQMPPATPASPASRRHHEVEQTLLRMQAEEDQHSSSASCGRYSPPLHISFPHSTPPPLAEFCVCVCMGACMSAAVLCGCWCRALAQLPTDRGVGGEQQQQQQGLWPSMIADPRPASASTLSLARSSVAPPVPLQVQVRPPSM